MPMIDAVAARHAADPPAYEALASESARLVKALAPVLSRTLRMTAGDTSLSPLESAVPVLTFQVFPLNANPVVEASGKQRVWLLAEFARLVIHSQTLRALRKLKTAFWVSVLASEMMDTSTSGVDTSLLGKPESPQYVIDFCGLETFDATLAEVLMRFMTMPAASQDETQVQGRPRKKKIAFGLSFANCDLTSTSLQLLEGFLDRVFAHPNRQYGIDLLDLSDNRMDASELAIVAEIMKKNAAYQIEELKLNNIVSDETPDGVPIKVTPNEYQRILRVVLNPLQAPPRPSRPKLKRVTMKGNDLCAKPFAALGSALRYGSPVVEEFLSNFVVDNCHSAEVKRECWQWLAFGLFYPRPKRFAGGCRLRKLGSIQCTLRAMAVCVETLRNPVVQLLKAGEHGRDEASSEETNCGMLIVCTVKKGARIQIIESGSLKRSPAIPMMSDERTDLDALYENPTNGSVCVVVPGVGLGWIQQDDVEKMEREPVEHPSAQLDGKYDVKFVYSESQETQPIFRQFIKRIGRHLRRVDCSNCRFLDGTLQLILESCPHLEHLNLQACSFAAADADALLVAVDGELGSRLLSLNLNRLLIGDAFVQRLAAVLSKKAGDAPVLQELRLNDTDISARALASLHSALSVNHALRSLELKEASNVLKADEGLRFRQSFHRQLLRCSVPEAQKLAFLSIVAVVENREDATRIKKSARDELDQWLLTVIFQFAATEITLRVRVAVAPMMAESMSPTVAELSPRSSNGQAQQRVSLLKKLQRFNAKLFMVKKLLFVVLIFALDIRDIVYKIAWIGPMDSYSFVSGSTSILHPVPLVSAVTPELRALDAGEHVASGWSSFLSQCDELYAFGADGGPFFLSALAKNCRIPVNSSSNNGTRVVPQLVLTSNIRADAPIWASCLLLLIGRRPPICQDQTTSYFNNRYAFFATTTLNSDVAPIDSETETEILRFLDLMSTSIPMHRVICVEAFELTEGETGTFTANLFGCASPNLYRSEFVGFATKGYQKLLHGKGWLTNDDISVLGQRFGIRQNAKSVYTIAHSPELNTISVQSHTSINFSSYGALYAVMVVIDLFLLLTHCYSFFEIFKWIFSPKYRDLQHWIREFETSRDDKMVVPEYLTYRRQQQHKKPSNLQKFHHQQDQNADNNKLIFREERFYSFFCASYYKSPSYVWLMRLTRVISWIIILPNSVVWTWSDSQNEKAQAYLSSIKSWVLISSAVQILWQWLVRANEKRAYQFVKGTYITNPEIIVIGAIASVQLRDEIFLMCEKKWAIENQRVNDVISFLGGYIAHGNTFQKANDFRSTTTSDILQILYGPLFHIILLSLGMIVAWLVLKFVIFLFLARVGVKEKRSNAIVVDTMDLKNLNESARDLTRSSSKDESICEGKTYARLPLEDVLDIPIRANSLVRYGLSMEIVRDGKWYIRPSCYLDYGIMLKHGEWKPHSVSVTDLFKNKTSDKRSISDITSAAEAIASSRSLTASLKFFSESRTNSLLEAATPNGQDALLKSAMASQEAGANRDLITSIIQESDDIEGKTN